MNMIHCLYLVFTYNIKIRVIPFHISKMIFYLRY